ncbi:MAG: SUMF1/EgtB/PvdO family nonheme iron enzyme [Nibricoccus sp.]
MRNYFLILYVLTLVLVPAWSQTVSDRFVLVQGGTFLNTKAGYHGKNVTVASFYLGKYEVTQKEWLAVMGDNPSQFKGDDLPVEMVSWYDCIEYCNKRSLQEGLKPYYTINRDAKDPNNESANDDVKWTVTINVGTNGYRLPTEAEWEFAAGGGRLSRNFIYSGSDELDKVGWFWQNAGDTRLEGAWNWPLVERNNNKTHAVGGKAPNELGLCDLSGNVREWCCDWFGEVVGHGADPKGPEHGAARVWKGGGWLGGDFCCASSFRGSFDANSRGPDQGFRVCRSK